ncbi:hypothetical protein MKI84_13015 [Ancylobacter sp. A5.8]|uniref:hypothetical protein n=1 Tax=Ancylobacter gelatini TaxID=2919920 RepID=UPI001F4E95A2|nr:hypothetical protein [Ancylobacter gelatini]MCJ8143838.1 hypothetical protein [Ancylobacter gelatini]
MVAARARRAAAFHPLHGRRSARAARPVMVLTMTQLATTRPSRSSSALRVSAAREVAVAKIVVNIPFVVWREGRPRYVATPAHRKLGFKGEDLRRAGEWLTLDQAADWSARRAQEVEERRQEIAAARAGRRRIPALRQRQDIYTIAQMIQDWQDPTRNPRFGSSETMKGKRRIKPLARASRIFYAKMARAIEQQDEGQLWAAPAQELTRRAVHGLYERLTEERGLPMARGIIGALSAAWAFAHNHGKLGPSPFARLGMESPDPRLRVGSVHEMRSLIATADAVGYPEIGDSIVMGLMTGQRQRDRLLLVDGRDLDGRLLFRQKKTGAVVLAPPTAQLVERLRNARVRRQGFKVQHAELIINEQSRRPFSGERYRQIFGAVRAAAVAGVADGAGGWKVEPCPSLADFRDQDLRDTSVTWMALAGATIPEIISVTGHSEKSASQILKHYLGRHPEMAASAVGKAARWLEGKGGL